jgi:hypothetical protein
MGPAAAPSVLQMVVIPIAAVRSWALKRPETCAERGATSICKTYVGRMVEVDGARDGREGLFR